jgi:hypothetical protein
MVQWNDRSHTGELTLTPLNWKFLQRRIVRVKVDSHSDGTFKVVPQWRKGYAFGEPKCPGIMTRMACAEDLQKLLNRRFRHGT